MADVETTQPSPIPTPTVVPAGADPVPTSTALQPVKRRKPTRPEEGAPPVRKRSLRSFILPLVILAAFGYAASAGWHWFTEGRFIVSTDDAYVGAPTAIISAKVSGHVVAVPVTNNQPVHAGDLLARIDDGDYRLAVEAARNKIASQEATMDRIQRQIDAQASLIAQAEAQVVATRAQWQGAEAEQQRAALEYDRSEKMAQTSFGSQQRLEQAAADRSRTLAAMASAQATAQAAVAALAGAHATLDVLQAQKVEAERVRRELVTAAEKAERDLSFTELRAPFDGVVGNKSVEVGQLAQPGVRLMALVDPDRAYVDANFKETQLEAIRPGQKVDVAVDLLGGRSIAGVVTSISPATGSQFSLLPPDNATGNFTKVVQRVPVRIALPPGALRQTGLMAGLSVVAAVHTRDDSLPRPTLLGALGIEATASERASRS